jgi:hypothetical protein
VQDAVKIQVHRDPITRLIQHRIEVGYLLQACSSQGARGGIRKIDGIPGWRSWPLSRFIIIFIATGRFLGLGDPGLSVLCIADAVFTLVLMLTSLLVLIPSFIVIAHRRWPKVSPD